MINPNTAAGWRQILDRRRACVCRGQFAVVALLLLVGAPTAAVAQRSRGVEVENMRVGFDASMALKSPNAFKIGTWTPVWVQLRGGSERYSGIMEVSVA